MIAQEFPNAPDMIGQATGHGWSQQHFSRFSLGPGCPPAQFLMWHTEVVGTSQRPHAAFQSRQTPGRMPTFAHRAGESLAHRAVQAFNKGGIEYRSSMRSR